MKLDMVGRTAGELLAIQRDMLERLSGNDGDLWLERYKRLHNGENPFVELTGENSIQPSDAWKAELVAYAKRKLKKFSRPWADQVTAIPDRWTPDFVTNATKYGYKPVFVPTVDISADSQRPKYIKLGDWYYQNIRNGNIKTENPTQLQKGWYLADSSLGVDYTDGSQIFPSDWWKPMLSKLRKELSIIGRHDKTPNGSRFSITYDEWIQVVLAHWAGALMTTRAQTNLPTAAEWNFVGNVYFPHYGANNMWVWFTDVFEDVHQLIGGYRAHGGLTDVNYDWHGGRFNSVAGRPLVSFVS